MLVAREQSGSDGSAGSAGLSTQADGCTVGERDPPFHRIAGDCVSLGSRRRSAADFVLAAELFLDLSG